MTDRRRIILAGARRRYADGQRLDLGWSWAQCLKTAAAADRIRRNAPRAVMAEAAAVIREHVERRDPDRSLRSTGCYARKIDPKKKNESRA